MKTKTFAQSFGDVHRLTKTDIKPLGAKLGKLMEEVGELAECVNIHQGYITHKVMKEPLVGEVADVVQCALAVLVDAHPAMSKKQVMEMFLEHFERKNGKWETVQDGDEARVAAKESIGETEVEGRRPLSDPGNVASRVYKITAEQLGLAAADVTPDAKLVDDYGADSLDLVELVMAIEDEFEFEISDRDAERLFTVRQIISYINARYGIIEAEDVADESDQEVGEFHLGDVPKDTAAQPHYDPADDYTERTGRYLSLEERMQERSRFNNKG